MSLLSLEEMINESKSNESINENVVESKVLNLFFKCRSESGKFHCKKTQNGNKKKFRSSKNDLNRSAFPFSSFLFFCLALMAFIYSEQTGMQEEYMCRLLKPPDFAAALH